MKKLNIAAGLILALSTTYSAHIFAVETHCATAEGDIRALQAEKMNVAGQIKAGVTSIVPVSAFVHIVKGTEVKTIKVATGDYNDQLDTRIAEIKQQCGK